MAMSVTAMCDRHYLSHYGAITEDQATSSTTEVTLGTITIPADAIGPTGWVKITAIWKKSSTSTAYKARIKFGATLVKEASFTSSNTVIEMVPTHVWNKNDISVQSGGMKHSTIHAFNSAISPTEDTTANVDVTFTGFVGVGSAALTLLFASIEVFRTVRPA